MSSDFDRLQILFSRTSSLPELPGTLQRLIAAIDQGEATALDLERVITSDPALALALIRVANTKKQGYFEPVSTIRAAVMRLGQKPIRTLAMSLIMQNLVHSKHLASGFPGARYAGHVLVSAYLARYIYARRHMGRPMKTEWSADEVFAAALLHDIGVLLLAYVAPESYQRVHGAAERTGVSFQHAFAHIYRQDLSELGASAAEAWGLPRIFVDTVRFASRPWDKADEFSALSCVNYADCLASVYGCTLESWPLAPKVEWEVQNEVGLADEEAAQVLELISEDAFAHMDSVNAQAA